MNGAARPAIEARRPPRAARNFPSVAAGFTLIELMVGMTIGLLVTVVIAQVFVVAEGRKRSTTAGSDAQLNGALMLYDIQRDVQAAGYGLTTAVEGIGCEIRARLNGVDSTWVLAPVVIVPGAAGAPDTVRVMASAKTSYSVPVKVTENHPRTAANFLVSTTLGVGDGDMMIAVPRTIDADNWCSVFNVTGTGGAMPQVLHNSGASGPWNQPGGQTIFPTAGYPAGSYLVNLGNFVQRAYSVSGGALQVTAFDSGTGTSTTDSSAAQIVNLKALYGKDTDGDGTVDSYDATTPTTNAQWRQVLAVRIAVVARSEQFEKEDVTTAAPVWDLGAGATVAGSTSCGSSRCLTLQVDGAANWRRYRYKVYDTVIPLRNMLWRS